MRWYECVGTLLMSVGLSDAADDGRLTAGVVENTSTGQHTWTSTII